MHWAPHRQETKRWSRTEVQWVVWEGIKRSALSLSGNETSGEKKRVEVLKLSAEKMTLNLKIQLKAKLVTGIISRPRSVLFIYSRLIVTGSCNSIGNYFSRCERSVYRAFQHLW